MNFWIQSLQENAFDVFTLVYITVLVIMYHYLNRWRSHNNKIEIIEELNKRR